VAEPEDIEAGFVAVDEFFMIVRTPANINSKHSTVRIKPCSLGGFQFKDRIRAERFGAREFAT
jgi:hypothetical protein